MTVQIKNNPCPDKSGWLKTMKKFFFGRRFYVSSSYYEILDPATGKWTFGTIPATSGHTMGITLPNGKVLYITSGGASWAYDPVTNTWTPTANFGDWYSRGCATLLRDGKVLVMAYYSGNYMRCDLYDCWTNTIIPASFTNQDHHEGPVEVMLPGGKVMIAGGQDFLSGSRNTEIYDPGSGTWIEVGLMNIARAGFVGILLPPPMEQGACCW